MLTIDGQSAGDVSDIAGNLLDGEWNNPTSLTQGSSDTFPSGNGTPGGTFEFFLTIMPGNPSLDNVIDQDDLDPVLLNWGMSSATFQQGDTGGGGAIDQADLDNVLLQWGVDFSQWPGGEFLMMGGGAGSNRLDALHALDAALTRLGMQDKVTERLFTERRMEQAASNQRAWDALISDIAAALDD